MKIVLAVLVLLLAMSVAPEVAAEDSPWKIRKETVRLLKSGQYEEAWEKGRTLVLFSNNNASDRDYVKVVDLFRKKYPESLPFIYDSEKSRIEAISRKPEVSALSSHISVYETAGLISKDQARALSEFLIETAIRKSNSGELQFTLTDRPFNRLESYESDRLFAVYQNSVNQLEQDAPCCTLHKRVFDIAQSQGNGSKEYAYLASKIGEINLPFEFLESEAFAVLPQEATKLLSEREIRLAIANESSDSFVVFEFEDSLRQQPSFTILSEPDSGSLLLTLKGVKIAERNLPERSQTIRYNRWEVNVVGGVFFMPDGATFDFEEVSGGFEVRYSGIFELSKANEVIDARRFSGRAEAKYSYCKNARITNVFGGVTRADFVPNGDYQRRCFAGKTSVDTDVVFKSAIEEMVEEVMKLGPIAAKL